MAGDDFHVCGLGNSLPGRDDTHRDGARPGGRGGRGLLGLPHDAGDVEA